MKNKYTSIKLLALVSIFGFMLFSGARAYAVEPGCYRGGGTADRPTYTKEACPNPTVARQVVDYKACFLFVGSGVQQASCEDLTRPPTAEAQSTGSSGSQGSSSGVDVEESAFKDSSKGCNEGELTQENCRIIEYLVVGINVLSAIAGMVIVFSMIFAGFQYMTAQDNASQIQQARQRIIWAISAMLIFIFMYALLNFLVPGGVL